MSESLVQMRGITKRFPGIVALKDVDLEVGPGEIHGLLGENGAGKSTLIKILTGAYRPDEGEIALGGDSYSHVPIKELDRLGIAAVYQDLKLAPEVSVVENILMGNLPKRMGGLFVDYAAALELSREALSRAGAQEIDPKTPVGELKIADQELVAIAKALSKKARLIILDEPTALLAEDDVERLFGILRDLANRDVSILYISHKLEEIFAICHRVTVLRDGQKIWTKRIEQITEDELIAAISGEIRAEEDVYTEAKVCDHYLLKVEGLTKRSYYDNVSFQLRGGEVLGLFGLVGAGKSELLKGIFGSMPADSGKIFLEEEPHNPDSPRESIEKGVGFLPEDRGSEGLFVRLPIYVNVNLPTYRRLATAGWITPTRDKRRAQEVIEGLGVRYSSVDQAVDELSGGNQQKVLLARSIGSNIKVLLLDEPTAGIDVGARREIFRLTRRLAVEGKGVIYSSSYLPEIMEVADRILVMSRGRISGEFSRKDGFDELKIMKAAHAAEYKGVEDAPN
ncbi:Arabinose import ATP-binding protein AraG [Rubrobacter xylanophilus DSM 9941]|uniref:sugar ABC transporter ATP-binding protein n=1 Tax=Rubrobacter xylanophilus TaxID=49319 RepID=UPI001C63F02D|nr:sugar ABC transporter ATP-binding protein [Rubrobacter xylanophilus]QYJ17121.1 Arabinose import ATP-binding protein AraG [Rubrobacter xylanophilus DSM 9941]